MAVADEEQQFCLRWNNFQANITSQFETLRDDEDFTDVTIACEGQRIQAHKVVLSACSPFFKELFKSNPCSHPIIFMRDVEAHSIVALMEFMYAGEVNVAQSHLTSFLKTAESLKIRGLTDTPTITAGNNNNNNNNSPQLVKDNEKAQTIPENTENISSPAAKKTCNNPEFGQDKNLLNKNVPPKAEMQDYLSDFDFDDNNMKEESENNNTRPELAKLPGGMEIIPQSSGFLKEMKQDFSTYQGTRLRMRRSSEQFQQFDTLQYPDDPPELSALLQNRPEDERHNKLIRLAEGIEVYEEQLRSVKWSDYRKLTRGLATILFSPAELATCSVTGQRWSRAGNGERPVKPALDRTKVQAIISYVATQFPMVEISRIKQVLAYKCKENSTAFKMKAVRYYGEHFNK